MDYVLLPKDIRVKYGLTAKEMEGYAGLYTRERLNDTTNPAPYISASVKNSLIAKGAITADLRPHSEELKVKDSRLLRLYTSIKDTWQKIVYALVLKSGPVGITLDDMLPTTQNRTATAKAAKQLIDDKKLMRVVDPGVKAVKRGKYVYMFRYYAGGREVDASLCAPSRPVYLTFNTALSGESVKDTIIANYIYCMERMNEDADINELNDLLNVDDKLTEQQFTELQDPEYITALIAKVNMCNEFKLYRVPSRSALRGEALLLASIAAEMVFKRQAVWSWKLYRTYFPLWSSSVIIKATNKLIRKHWFSELTPEQLDKWKPEFVNVDGIKTAYVKPHMPTAETNVLLKFTRGYIKRTRKGLEAR